MRLRLFLPLSALLVPALAVAQDQPRDMPSEPSPPPIVEDASEHGAGTAVEPPPNAAAGDSLPMFDPDATDDPGTARGPQGWEPDTDDVPGSIVAPEGWVPGDGQQLSGAEPGAGSLQTFGLRPADQYFAIRERPLFTPDRSPPYFSPPETEQLEAEPAVLAEEEPDELPALTQSAPDWELVGVVRSEGLNSAMFRRPGESASFSLRKGESRDGWMLADIGRFEVYVQNASGRAKLAFPEPN
jgi:hypothetical protein